jgi:cytochrome c-type biogenesis protein CcmH
VSVRPLLALPVVLLLLGPAAIAGAAEPRTNLPDIEDEVMCPICGTLLELSDSPQAERERQFIRDQIDQGRSKDEIKDALVVQYGDDVLATPDSGGFDLTAWIVPALGILLGVLGVGWAILKLARRRDGGEPTPDIDPAESSRLDRDMSSYDL